MLIERIDAALVEAARKEDRGSPLRLSNAGRCARQTAYRLHNFEPEPLSARRLRTFEYGHLVEAALRKWAAGAGEEILYAQDDVTLDCGEGLLVSGHIDGRLVLDGVEWLLEIKSISTDGFMFAAKDGPDYSYLAQANAYMAATGVPRTLFIFCDKNDQELCEFVVLLKPELVEEIKQRFRRVAASTPEALPDREHAPIAEKGDWRGGCAPAFTPAELITKKGWYKPTGRKILPWQCGYCDFHRQCWGVGDPEIVKGKPVWVVEESALSGFMK
jgi:hypothetical protein